MKKPNLKLPKLKKPKLKSSKKKKRKKSKAKKKKTQVKKKKYKLPSVPKISRVEGRLERTKDITACIYFLLGIVFLIVMILQVFGMI